MPKQPKVFLSYSHQDEKWMQEVLKSLQPLVLQKHMDFWVDTRIKPGDDWYREIHQAISEADIGILLLSRDFLASEFIHNEEIPALLKQKAENGMLVLSVLACPCPWDTVFQLKNLQIWRYQDKALSEIRGKAKLDNALSDLTRVVYDFVNNPKQALNPGKTDGQTNLAVSDSDTPGDDFIEITDHVDVSRLPKPGSELFGRNEELKQLSQAWQDNDTHIISLIAWGGVGKSTLVYKWLQFLAAHKFDGAEKVLAWSFYSQGTNNSVTSGEDFINFALNWFGDKEPSQGSAHEKGQRLATLIQKQKTLLLLDGLEPLQSGESVDYGKLQDQGMAALLRNLALHNSGLCVISSRVEVADIAHYGSKAPVRKLEKLTPQSGRALLHHQGVRGKAIELEAAVEEFDGHALAISLLPGYLRPFTHHPAQQALHIPDLPEVSINNGKHPRRVIAVITGQLSQQVQADNGYSGSIELLHLLGLFDRPVHENVLNELIAEPVISGLTDTLSQQGEAGLLRAITRLRDQKLIAPHSTHQPDKIDCHPLIREHFAHELKQKNDAWQAAHGRLYEYFKNQPENQQPDTLEAMEPLFQAVRHGCLAGQVQQALNEVYWTRIRHVNKNYLCNQLGAYGSDLACVSNFFSQPWLQPNKNLTPQAQAVVLNWAGFPLRALGRLTQAQQPMRAGLRAYIEQKNWKNAARAAENLSGLNLTMGQVSNAVEYGQQAVDYAHKSEEGLLMEVSRAAHADALLQQGQFNQAWDLFRDAEQRQQQSQPEYKFLYSLQGFQYCDYWLTQAEVDNVLERASYTLKLAQQHGLQLLTHALDQLSIAKASYARSLTHDKPEQFDKTLQQMNQAVDGLRKAGANEFILKGLLARLQLYIDVVYSNHNDSLQLLQNAWQDLNEIDEMVSYGDMKLYLVEYYLSVCRLVYAQLALHPQSEKWQIWQDGEQLSLSRIEMERHYLITLNNADRLIQDTGYHRRDNELASLKNLDITQPTILAVDSPIQPRPDWLPPFVNKL